MNYIHVKRWTQKAVIRAGLLLLIFSGNWIQAADWRPARGLTESRGRPAVLSRHMDSEPDRQVVLYRFPEEELVDLGEGISEIRLGNAEQIGEIGRPVLPVVPARIAIPQGHEVVSVRVTPLERRVVAQRGVLLRHAEKPYPLSRPDLGTEPTPRDPEVYESDRVFPETLSVNRGVQRKRGVEFVNLLLRPVRYNPRSGRIVSHGEMRVVVVTRPADAQSDLSARFRGNRDRAAAGILLDNPDTLEGYQEEPVRTLDATEQTGEPAGSEEDVDGDSGLITLDNGEWPDLPCSPGEEYRYVIVTSRDLRDTTEQGVNFKDLAALRTGEGLSATIISVQSIYSSYGGLDNAESVRNFIRDAYDKWGTEYVLLGGAPEVVPMRKLWCEAYPAGPIDELPSDLYFQCLDGSYNSDGDSRWGEPDDGADIGGGSGSPYPNDVDLYAEVAVGRIPVRSPADVSRWMRKLVRYNDSKMDPGGNPYVRGALMAGEHLGFGGVSEYATETMEEIRLGSDAHGYVTKGFAPFDIYTDVGTLYDSPQYDWPKEELAARMNSGGFAVMNHLGHGNIDYLMKFGINDVDALLSNETMPIFLYSQACLSGAFDEICIGEEMTSGSSAGLFGAVLNSRFGWGLRYSTDGPSQRFNRRFWDAFFADSIPHLGTLNQRAHEGNIATVDDACIRWVMYASNLFGDPAQQIYGVMPVLSFDRERYQPSADATISLDWPTVPAAVNAIEVALEIRRGGAPVLVQTNTCSKTTPGGTLFESDPIDLAALGVLHDDLLVASWTNPGDGVSYADEALIDGEPPRILEFSVERITEDRFTVRLVCDEPTVAEVFADTDLPPSALTRESGAYATEHVFEFSGLPSFTKFYLAAEAEDLAGNTVTDPAAPGSVDPPDYLFAITRGRETVYRNDFERNVADWNTVSLEGPDCWEYGVPQFGPLTADTCWGTRIHGRYPNSANAILVSPVVQVRESPEIRFRHWRDMQRSADYLFSRAGRDEDCGYIEVLSGGVWHNVTEYADTSGGQDSVSGRGDWESVRLRLPESFANRPIQVRFRFLSDELTFGRDNPAGWYIDNFEVLDIPGEGLMISGMKIDDSPPGGDGDGYAEPGETVDLLCTVFNFSPEDAINVNGELVVLSSGLPATEVTLPNGSPASVHYGTIPAGEFVQVSEPITVRIGANINPDTVLTVLQTLTDGAGKVYETGCNLPVHPRVSLSGTVYDKLSEDPIEGAVIQATHAWEAYTTTSLSNGFFALEGAVSNTVYNLKVWKPGEYSATNTQVRAPASGLEFYLGNAGAGVDPGLLAFDLGQGQSATAFFTLTNTGASLPLDYVLGVEYLSENGWLGLDPVSGRLPPGSNQVVSVTADSIGLTPGTYPARIVVESNDPSEINPAVDVFLTVRERPWPAVGPLLVTDDDNDDGKLQAGESGNLWIRILNTNGFSAASILKGTLSAADPGQATISPLTNSYTWLNVPAGGSAWPTSAVPVALSPALTEGEEVGFLLDVEDIYTNVFHLSFSIVNHSYFSITGVVNSVLRPNLSDPEPVDGAEVRAELPDGQAVAAAFTDTNGVYRISGLRSTNYWLVATAPSGQELTAPAGREVDLVADREENFIFIRNAENDPRLELVPPVLVDDSILGNGDGIVSPGEELELTALVRNMGGLSAQGVTGRLETVISAIPDIMTVTREWADEPVNVLSETPVALQPEFRVRVHNDAPKNGLQRFQLTVWDNADPPREWPFNFNLRVDPGVIVTGQVNYADGNTAAKLSETRLRITAGSLERTLAPSSNGTFRVDGLTVGMECTIAITRVSEGYALPAPVVFPSLGEDQFVTFWIQPWQVDFDPASLDFAFAEGQSVTGELTVSNHTLEPTTIRAGVAYQRGTADIQPPALDPFLAPIDWDHLDPGSYREDEIIVRFQTGLSRDRQKRLLAQNGLEPVFFFNSIPAALARNADFAATGGPAALAAALEADPGVLYVEPNPLAEKTATTPNDALFDELWGLDNRRQTGGTLGADIRAAEAWDITTGSKDVVVAVCDTGVDIRHEDLAGNIWLNPSPGSSDEDIENDLHGWNFYDWNNDVRDGVSHGTHVAGTIGAVGSNALGVAGVNWNVSIMPLRLTDLSGMFTDMGRIARAIEYAVDNGARVSNHSWGGPNAANILYEAINYARTNNHLVVVSAGNSAQDVDKTKIYPAYYSTVLANVITVAAADHDDELASFSCFGAESVHLAAPGVDILSTIPSFSSFDETEALGEEGFEVRPTAGGYAYKNGTSMAAPHVAGAAALLWSLSPDADYEVIKAALLNGARRDPKLDGWVKTAGHLDLAGAIAAFGWDWLDVVPAEATISAGGEATFDVVANNPARLRAGFYEAAISLSDDRGKKSVPVSATVSSALILSIAGVEIVNLEAYADSLAPSPGDQVELWVTLRNEGSAFDGDVIGILSGGAGGTILENTTSWDTLFGNETTLANTALRVQLDPAGAGSVVYELEISRSGSGTVLAVLPITINLLPGSDVTGRVVSSSGPGVENARVEVWGALGRRTRTVANGDFRVRGLPDGNYKLRVISEDYERSAIEPFAITGMDAALPDTVVSAPQVQWDTHQIQQTLIQGASDVRTLSVENLTGIAPGDYQFDIHVAPLRKVALISDGPGLGPLVEPLERMGFDVTRYDNNFRRTQRVWADNTRELVQYVVYSWDEALLNAYDAVVADLTASNGLGRVFSDIEMQAFSAYLERGGKVIFTGANPLSLPDNEGLAALAGIANMDRSDSVTNQAAARLAFESPFVDLAAGDVLRSDNRRNDLAPPAGASARFSAGEANKLVRRSVGETGAVYLWGGNLADADWAEQGLWNDVVRGILWRELIEDARVEVPWLRLSTETGTIAPGYGAQLDLNLDAAYPLRRGTVQASLMVVGNESGYDVDSVRVTLEVEPATLRAFTSRPVTDWRGVPLEGDGSSDSDLFQLVWAGEDGVIAPPLPDGQPGGDDQALAVYPSGYPFGRFGVGLEIPPDSGRFDETFRHWIPEDAAAKKVYVRAWDGKSFASSLVWGDSPLYALTHQPGEEHDFGGWSIANIVNYGRDSNGDSVPDGYTIENLSPLDPRAPVVPLESAATYLDKVGISIAGTASTQPHRVVASEKFLFVLDTPNNRIVGIDRVTKLVVSEYGGGDKFAQPLGLALDPGANRLVVADTQNHRIQILNFDPNTGAISFQSLFGMQGSADGRFNAPSGVAVLRPGGGIFVADTSNNRIQRFGSTGSHQLSIDNVSGYEMNRPRGIAVDATGIWVTDSLNHRVLHFTHGGGPLGKFGSYGTGAAQFWNPVDIKVWEQTRPDATVVRRLCVVDSSNNRVQLLLPDGTHLLDIGGYGTVNGKLRAPYGAFPISDENLIYVADTGNERVQWFGVLLDADGDGMDDFWEDRNGLDSSDPGDAFEDPDGDGLLNVGEYRVGSDPLSADSNGNGVGDLWHLYNGLDPSDPNVVLDPAEVQSLQSLSAATNRVSAGETVVISAVINGVLPDGAAVLLTLTGASPLGQVAMTRSNDVLFVYTHTTQPNESGMAQADLFSGWLDPSAYSDANLFEVVATGGELDPFPILNISHVPPELTWDAVIDGVYRVERSLDITVAGGGWTTVAGAEAIVADNGIMTWPIPLDEPRAYFRVVRTE